MGGDGIVGEIVRRAIYMVIGAGVFGLMVGIDFGIAAAFLTTFFVLAVFLFLLGESL